MLGDLAIRISADGHYKNVEKKMEKKIEKGGNVRKLFTDSFVLDG